MREKQAPLPVNKPSRGHRLEGPVDAAGAAAAVDGSSKYLSGAAVHSRLDAGKRTPAPTAPWKTGKPTPVSHSADRPHRRSTFISRGLLACPGSPV